MRNLSLSGWLARLGVSLPFFLLGMEKFSNQPGTHWVLLFSEIGFGSWFRYLAGIVEISGALLVMIPRLTIAGIVLLAITMGVASVIVAFVLKHPAQSLFPGVLLVALAVAGFCLPKKDSSDRISITGR